MSEDYLASPEFRKELESDYNKSKSLYESLVEEATYILTDALRKSDIKIQSLTCREGKIKSFESFYKKVVGKAIRDKQFETVEDIAGIRVICLYRSDLEKVGKVITDNFDIIRLDTSRTRTETPFGYASDHYIVKLQHECKGARCDRIKNIKCEIQVRTLLMNAWASVSHHLVYKQETDVPRELKADLNALTGLFYVADTHFEMIKEGIVESRKSLMKTVEKGTFNVDQEINLDSLSAYMRLKFPERDIEAISSDIVSELADKGYKTIRQLDEKMEIGRPALETVENTLKRGRSAPDGMIRILLDLTDDKFFKRHLPFLRTVKEHPSRPDILEFKEYYSIVEELRSKIGKSI
jgi:ppGpp synthetase/RelA/SpoT-type nucleotidyltranferase